jgi:hypothetical protein
MTGSLRNLHLCGLTAYGLFLLTAQPAIAGTDIQTANFLLPGCRYVLSKGGPIAINPGEEILAYQGGICYGVVSTVAMISRGSDQVCTPAGMTVNQATAVTVRYAEKIPGRWNEPLAALAIEAIHQEWPCK